MVSEEVSPKEPLADQVMARTPFALPEPVEVSRVKLQLLPEQAEFAQEHYRYEYPKSQYPKGQQTLSPTPQMKSKG